MTLSRQRGMESRGFCTVSAPGFGRLRLSGAISSKHRKPESGLYAPDKIDGAPSPSPAIKTRCNGLSQRAVGHHVPLLAVREPHAAVLIGNLSCSPLTRYGMSGRGGMSENPALISSQGQPGPSPQGSQKLGIAPSTPVCFSSPRGRRSTPGWSWWRAFGWRWREEKPGGPRAGRPSGRGDTGRGSATCAGSSSAEGEGGTGTWPRGARLLVFPFWRGGTVL